MSKTIAFVSMFLIFVEMVWPPAYAHADMSFGQALQNRQSSGGSTKNDTKKFPGEKTLTGEGGSTGSSLMGSSYQVHVLGQVENPGTYRIDPSVRVAEAIGKAGGVAKVGSQRQIEIRRNSGKIQRADLFRFMQKGDLNANPFLQDNDTIFIPFVERSVRIEGPVKKTGVYELAGEKVIWDVIELAGGYTAGASIQSQVVVIRYGEDSKKNPLRVDNVPEKLKEALIQNGDMIVIPHILTKNTKFDYNVDSLPSDNVFYPTSNDGVFVIGAVARPGPYSYNPQLGMRGYINMSGPTQFSKIQSARIMTAEGKSIHNIKRYSLNPGDTIIVPERKLTATNVLSWYSTFAGTIFTGIALKSLVE